jgi:hypothetical protein
MAILPPEAILLTAPVSGTGIETGGISLCLLDFPDQVPFLHLSRLDPLLRGHGAYLFHLHFPPPDLCLL